MSVVMNAGDRNPFFLEAGAWFTASGACEVLVDRGPTKIRQKIGATEQQVGPFLSDAQILIIATAETTYLVRPPEAWVPRSELTGGGGADLVGIAAGGTVQDYLDIRAFDVPLTGSDDTAALIAALAAQSSIELRRNATTIVTGQIAIPASRTIICDNSTISSTVSGSPTILVENDNVRLYGKLTIDCNNASNSTGWQIGANTASGSSTTQNFIEWLVVRQATDGFEMLSDGNHGIFYNHFNRINVGLCTNGIRLKTSTGGANARNVNANTFGVLNLTGAAGIALDVDGADGTEISYLEAESNSGTALKLRKCFGITIPGCWIEGNGVNIDIADVPLVYGVYISGAIDTALDAADTKFIYTPSTERAVVIQNQLLSTNFGRSRFERAMVGAYGNPANDQGDPADGRGRLIVTSSQDFFRKSSGDPTFYMSGRTGMDSWTWTLDDRTTTLLSLARTNTVLAASLTISGHAWDANLFRLGSYRIWVDSTGDLRIKDGAPASDTDGTVVGTQS